MRPGLWQPAAPELDAGRRGGGWEAALPGPQHISLGELRDGEGQGMAAGRESTHPIAHFLSPRLKNLLLQPLKYQRMKGNWRNLGTIMLHQEKLSFAHFAGVAESSIRAMDRH